MISITNGDIMNSKTRIKITVDSLFMNINIDRDDKMDFFIDLNNDFEKKFSILQKTKLLKLTEYNIQ